MNWRATTALELCLSMRRFAQSAGGVAGVSGVVKDPSGSAVPNAVVISTGTQGNVRAVHKGPKL
jgi:hypothetical protein